MALTTCTECGNEVSDRAPTCPQCGRAGPRCSQWQTKSVTWAVLIGLVAAGICYQGWADRQGKLPLLPVSVQYRHSLLGARSGYVFTVRNTRIARYQ